MTEPTEEYNNLPDPIKRAVTFDEYMWMGAENRARLKEDFTMPDVDED